MSQAAAALRSGHAIGGRHDIAHGVAAQEGR
jgi:hypothetical protein